QVLDDCWPCYHTRGLRYDNNEVAELMKQTESILCGEVSHRSKELEPSLSPIRIIKFPLLLHSGRQTAERNPGLRLRVLHSVSPLRVRSFGHPGGTCCH